MVFVRCSFLKDLKYFHFDIGHRSASEIRNDLSAYSGIPANSLVLLYNGKPVSSDQKVPNDSFIEVCFTLPGGKGGFGSMLRAIGAQIEKTTNREACRDLSGRRLRDINEEQRLKRWLAKKAEREAEQLRRRKERLERLKEMPRHEFHDPEYNKQRSELPDRIDAALTEGLKKKTSSADKRPASSSKDNGEPRLKKECFWLGDNISLSSEESDQDLALSSEENSSASQKGSSDSKDCNKSKASVHEVSDASNCSQEIQTRSQRENQREETSDSCSRLSETSSPETQFESQTENQQQETIDTCSTQSETPPQEIQVKSQVENEKRDELHNPSLDNGIKVVSECSGESEAAEINHSSDNKAPSVLADKKETEEQCTLDLLAFKSPSELESVGLEKLKAVLTSMGLKCGGTLAERAQRLWSVRGLDPKDYPRALRAKPKKN